MRLQPLGVAGSAGGGAAGTPYPTNTVVPGAIYVLDAWQGQTLRKLVISVASTNTWVGRVQIRSNPPPDLNPSLPHPGAQFDLPLTFVGVNTYSLDFASGLITVGYGEKLYLVVFDWGSPSSGASLAWSINHLWEPIGGER